MNKDEFREELERPRGQKLTAKELIETVENKFGRRFNTRRAAAAYALTHWDEYDTDDDDDDDAWKSGTIGAPPMLPPRTKPAPAKPAPAKPAPAKHAPAKHVEKITPPTSSELDTMSSYEQLGAYWGLFGNYQVVNFEVKLHNDSQLYEYTRVIDPVMRLFESLHRREPPAHIFQDTKYNVRTRWAHLPTNKDINVEPIFAAYVTHAGSLFQDAVQEVKSRRENGTFVYDMFATSILMIDDLASGVQKRAFCRQTQFMKKYDI